MQRLTFMENERWAVRDDAGNVIHGQWVDRLAQYENLEHLPDELEGMISNLKANETLDVNKPWREILNLPTRAVNALRFSRLTEKMSVAELAQMKEWDIARLRNIGEITRKQIADELARFGYQGTDWSLEDY